MDAYISLLNLNFMSSWRTGNTLIDMIIAIVIPLISNWVAHFFSVTWPSLLESFIKFFTHKTEQLKIQHGLTDKYNRAVDLTEGSILQEAVEHYINTYIHPFYAEGEFIYTGMPSEGGREKRKALVDLLQQDFKLISRPSKEKVNLGNGLTIEEAETEYEEDDKDSEKNNGPDYHHKGNLNKWGGGNRTRAKTTIRELIIEEKKQKHNSNDQALTFVKTAFEWYVKNIEIKASKQRYLYQPIRSNSINEYDSREDLMKVARYALFDTKTFKSLFFPEKEKLVALIDQFESKSGKFAVPGFPHKLTLLLHGPPGTGKTSLVKAIAQYTGRHILSIPLTQVNTNRELIACMHDEQFELEKNDEGLRVSLKADKVIYLLEDADATAKVILASKENKNIRKKTTNKSITPTHSLISDALSTKGLIEAFNGMLDVPKRIIVMTTNHIERLDSALIQPGFITMRLHMGNFTAECAQQMVTHYYGSNTATEIILNSLKDVLEENASRGIFFSPSEMEQLCAEYDDIEELINALKKGSKQNIF